MAEAKQTKPWYKQVWAMALFVIVGLLIIGSLSGDTSSKNKETVWTKSSGYTVDECNEVCDGTYDLAAQVTVCQGNCNLIYGKPSSKLDNYVNKVKDIKNRNSTNNTLENRTTP